jgi:hypothetical protein
VSRTQSIFEGGLEASREVGAEYRREISSLMPARKPSNRKDFFVFGLSDRSNTAESTLVATQTRSSSTGICSGR